jgi:hypothetical protein
MSSSSSSSYGDIFKINQLIPSSQLLEQIQDDNNIVTQNQEFFCRELSPLENFLQGDGLP